MERVTFTEGNITRQIVDFAWPVLLAGLFSELYNVTNSLIVGNYVSVHALSVVSACAWICNIYLYTFYGLGMGAGILITSYVGRGEERDLKEALDTALVFAVVGGVFLTVVSELALPWLMDLSNIHDELYADAEAYLRVYLLGNAAVLSYQMCGFIMRSFGDSLHPLYFLVVSSIINLVLGLFFVRVMGLGAVGTALATIISQFVVDVLSLRLLLSLDGLTFDIHDVVFSWEKALRICELGIPAGVQNLLIAISGMLVQSYVNLFPDEVISGIGVAERIGAWGQHPSSALSTATMLLVGQNHGAGRYVRVREAIRKTLAYALVSTAVLVVAIELTAPWLVGLFTTSEAVRSCGTEMLRLYMPSFMFIAVSHILNAACRSVGNVHVPMLIAVAGQCVVKYLFVRVGLALFSDVHVLYLGSAVGFAAAGTFAALYFYLGRWTKEQSLRA